MKVRLIRFDKYVTYLAKRLALRLKWQRALKSTRSAIGYFNQVPIVLLGKTGRTWVLGAVAFAKYCISLKSHSGLKGLAIHLKVAHTLLVKRVAGQPIKGVASSLGHRVGQTRSGLPKMIPKVHRREILKGDTRVVRVWLSWLSLYRVITFLGKPKLSTITSPGVAIDFSGILPFMTIFVSMLRSRKWLQATELPKWEPKMITKSGPGSVSALSKRQPPIKGGNTTSSLVVQAITWGTPEFKDLLSKFKELASLSGQSSLYDSLITVSSIASDIKGLAQWAPDYLGKLGIKEEPGKVRVFAMVDWWTQMLMRPLHKFLFEILRRIPNDATFDQDAGVRSGVEMLRKSGYAASYDLSAATDRLPVVIQGLLISHLLPKCGQLWAELLTERAYATPKALRKLGMRIPQHVHYAVGQPMGALSSWAMLALTHHLIVQYAARNVGYKYWFRHYLVLGDDIVIFNEKVADQYLVVMKALGVGINLVKSVVSKDSFEFAKRFYHKGENLSAVSFMELEVAGSSLEAMVQLLPKFSRGAVRVSTFAKFRGYGYKTLGKLNMALDKLPKHIRLLLVFLSMPGISKISFDSYVKWFGMTHIGHYKLPNLQSLQSHIRRWWDQSQPSGTSSVLTPRAIWACTLRGDTRHTSHGVGYDSNAQYRLGSGRNAILHWKVEQLEDRLQTLMWPQQLAYMAAHKAADAKRAEVELMLELLGDASGTDKFLDAFLEWDMENSLTPVHIYIHEHRGVDPVVRELVDDYDGIHLHELQCKCEEWSTLRYVLR